MMNENEFKQLIASKLTYYRRANNLTQIQLAEKLNYSDKAISKWERGESLPDLFVLSTIADLYKVTLNDLTTNISRVVKPKRQKAKFLISIISFGLVWLIATLIYVLLNIINPNLANAWLAFIYAIPASLIVLIVFSRLWGTRLMSFLSISCLYWSIPIAICASIDYPKLWLLYIFVIPLQILTILVFILDKQIKNNSK